MVRANIVSTNGPGGAAGRILSLQTVMAAAGYPFDGSGYLEFGNGTDGSLPWRVDQDGKVSVNGATTPQLLGTTGINGFAPQNGTPLIIAWTAPNDGALHRVSWNITKIIQSTETGGQVAVDFYAPDGTYVSWGLYPGGAGAGYAYSQSPLLFPVVKPGTQVSIFQGTALTGGASKVWAELWGS